VFHGALSVFHIYPLGTARDTLPKPEKTLDNNRKIPTLMLHHIPYFHTILPLALVILPLTGAAPCRSVRTAKIPHSNTTHVSVPRHPYVSP